MGDPRYSFAILFGLMAIYEAWQAIIALRLKRARRISFRKSYATLSDDAHDFWFATFYHGVAAAFAASAVVILFVWS